MEQTVFAKLAIRKPPFIVHNYIDVNFNTSSSSAVLRTLESIIN